MSYTLIMTKTTTRQQVAMFNAFAMGLGLSGEILAPCGTRLATCTGDRRVPFGQDPSVIDLSFQTLPEGKVVAHTEDGVVAMELFNW
jgi:hypothetical protein